MPVKKIWVSSWRDIPKSILEKNKVKSGASLRGIVDKNTIYLIRGKSDESIAKHEEFHIKKRHPSKEQNPRDYILHEMQANMYAYKETGQPKHILGRLRAIYNDIGYNVYKTSPQATLGMIKSVLIELKVPDTWKADFKELDRLVKKANS